MCAVYLDAINSDALSSYLIKARGEPGGFFEVDPRVKGGAGTPPAPRNPLAPETDHRKRFRRESFSCIAGLGCCPKISNCFGSATWLDTVESQQSNVLLLSTIDSSLSILTFCTITVPNLKYTIHLLNYRLTYKLNSTYFVQFLAKYCRD